MEPAQTIERERRWATPAGLLSLLAAALSIAAVAIVASKFGAGGNAERLRKINDDSGFFLLAYVVQGLGFALLAVPLLYLFRAAQARGDRVRSQLVGLTIAGPLFLAAGSILTALLLRDAAPDFVAKGVLGTGDHANNVAEDVIKSGSLADVTTGVGFAGALSFAFAMAYTCFQAMRVGLLTRFWGSLGAALGVASFVFSQYMPLWFIYLGLLIGGWTPRGRPPAWAAGKAIPWPTPGERAAESLQGEGGETIDGQATEVESSEHDQIGSTSGEVSVDPESGEASDAGEASQRRKRKRRR